MAFKIFPTENDVGVTTGDGSIGTEQNFATLFSKSLAAANNVVKGDGDLLCTHASGATISIAAGTAMINGYVVELTASETYDPAGVSHDRVMLWIKLVRSNGLVTGTQFVEEVNTLSGIEEPLEQPEFNIQGAADDRLLLCTFSTNGSGNLTNVYDFRQFRRFEIGTYVGNGTGASFRRNISLGWRPRLVLISGEVASPAKGQSEIMALKFGSKGPSTTIDYSYTGWARDSAGVNGGIAVELATGGIERNKGIRLYKDGFSIYWDSTASGGDEQLNANTHNYYYLAIAN